MGRSALPGNLQTRRLVLRPAEGALAGPVTDYYRRNRAFLAPMEPLREEEFFTPEGQRALLEQDERNSTGKSGYRFFIEKKEDPGRIIGCVALSSIVWGAFRSCFLAYKLDQQALNRGYMTEAAGRCVTFAFDTLGLHRVEANIMPRNIASLRVAEKLGFIYEGISRQYLCINGVWEDHVHMVKLNPQDTPTPRSEIASITNEEVL